MPASTWRNRLWPRRRLPPGADAAEVLVLQAYLYQARLTVAPLTRALRYSARTRETLEQAQRLAPTNPRLYFVLANDEYYKPRLLGGGPSVARIHYAQAQSYFAAARPTMPAAPSWGATQNQAALARCTRP